MLVGPAIRAPAVGEANIFPCVKIAAFGPETRVKRAPPEKPAAVVIVAAPAIREFRGTKPLFETYTFVMFVTLMTVVVRLTVALFHGRGMQ